MQLLRSTRAAHAADTDWSKVAFKATLSLVGVWFAIAFVAYYFVGYEGLRLTAKPFTVAGEWVAGMYLVYPSLVNAVMIGVFSLIGLAMLVTAVRHELPRMRAERARETERAVRNAQIDEQVADAADELAGVKDVVFYISTLPFTHP